MRKEFEIGNPDFDSIARKVINKLLLTSPNSGEISRASLADPKKIVERYRVYKDAEDGNTGDIIPFGIKPLDDTLGGMRKTFVTLFYSKTGGGKTRISLNIALNAALRGFRVMYISLEMSFNLLASCFDARLAWVDSKKIIFGKLDKNDKVKYKKSLKKLIQKNLNIWIVDVPQGINSAGIQNEIQLYRGRHGVDPDLVIVDYANLMEPNQRYMGRSEKYDYLFKELHEIAKAENVAILTATQESREASKGDIAKRNGEEREEGVHNIGLSNYMAPHCESVVRLKQSNTDKLQNRLVGIIDKSRYGANGIEVFMIAIWDRNYVGDENVIGLKVANPGTALRTRAPVTRVRKNTKLPKEVGYLLDLYENETVELLAA
jgi:KaiC/GvpD/RAD55 family RecA-like ATPase